ncbi:MAG TPA: hypothetical protein VHO03_02835 [Ignavibacteriales bacterium]|nr:hypothetical protein [Ignavibacteriales bacterium]
MAKHLCPTESGETLVAQGLKAAAGDEEPWVNGSPHTYPGVPATGEILDSEGFHIMGTWRVHLGCIPDKSRGL